MVGIISPRGRFEEECHLLKAKYNRELGFPIPRFNRLIVGSRIATDLWDNAPSDSDPNYPTIRVDGRGACLPVGSWRKPEPSLPITIA
jgi:hypothetical protein